MTNFRYTRCLLALGLLFFSQSATANIIHVPQDQPTIQAGIDSAAYADTVLVAPGTYTGPGNRDISFKSKRVVVMSDPTREKPVIDCQGTANENHRGFVFASAEPPSAILDGFTIINGYHGLVGGAIYVKTANPTIRNCIFMDNYAQQGGAMVIYASTGLTIDCIFYNNLSTYGSAIFIHAASPRIFNCTFKNNSGVGTIGAENNSYPRLHYSLFFNSEIRAEPAEPLYNIGPSRIFQGCNINYRHGGTTTVPANGVDVYFDVNPLICDSIWPEYRLSPESKCLPDNNDCDTVIGAFVGQCLPTDVGDDDFSPLPTKFNLGQNYPNPFNPSTTLEFALPVKSAVTLEIYNVLGEKIVTLLNGVRGAGIHTVQWDSRGADGKIVGSGLYVYRMSADPLVPHSAPFTQSKKMILVK